MIYVEKNPIQIKAYKFIGEITPELKRLNICALFNDHTEDICPECGKPIALHAIYNNISHPQIICPNTYIIEGDYNCIQFMSSSNFEELYKPLYKEVQDIYYEE